MEDSRLRLEKLGLEQEIIEKLLSFKEGEDCLYDSVFKITSISQADFREKVKDELKEEQSTEIYQKALSRKEFIAQYMANKQNASEPHYKALRCSQNLFNLITVLFTHR